MKNVSWKTTVFGIVAGLAFASVLVGFLLGKYNASDFSVALAALLSIVLPLWGLLQKDADKTGLPK